MRPHKVVDGEAEALRLGQHQPIEDADQPSHHADEAADGDNFCILMVFLIDKLHLSLQNNTAPNIRIFGL